MPLEKYNRRVGPDQSTGGVSQIVQRETFDVGPSIAKVGEKLNEIYEPILKDRAIEQAKRDAGEVALVRDADGNLVLPDKVDEGGTIYRKVFDKLVETNYLTSIGSDYQQWLDNEVTLRRTGEKSGDPSQFNAAVDAHTEGLIQGMDPRLAVEVRESFAREAMERKRAYANEWSRNKRESTIRGTMQQIDFFMREAADFRDNGLTYEENLEKNIKPMLALVDALEKNFFIGGEEAEAMAMKADSIMDGGMKYANSLKVAALLLPAIGGIEHGATLEWMLASLDGIETPREGLSGLVRDSEGGTEKVTPDLIKNVAIEMFGKEPTSGPRAGDHPLSIAARKKGYISHHDVSGPSGGRAIDVPKIPGMTFDEYVAKWKRAGFDVIEAKDEYKNPSALATGGHWHIAFGNTRSSGKMVEISELTEMTFEQLNGLDSSVKRMLKERISSRFSVLREDYQQARMEAAQEEQTRRIVEATQQVVGTIEEANVNGVGGNWSSKQRKILDQTFDAQIDFGKMADSNERAKVLAFAQKNNYIPTGVINYLENGIRGGDVVGAVELYQNIGQARLTSGARIGDLLLSKVDPKGAAMLQEVDNMVRLGSGKEVIRNRIEKILDGRSWTTPEAQQEYNRFYGDDKDRNYQNDKMKMIRRSLGLGDKAVIGKGLSRSFDAAFASNLDVVTNNPEKAMARAIAQTKGKYAKAGYFFEGHGPAVLTNSYSPRNIMDFMMQDSLIGPLIKRHKGTHRLGGPNSTITLSPADSQVDSIGRYRIVIRDPNNTNNPLNSVTIDLGEALREWAGKKKEKIKSPEQQKKEAEQRLAENNKYLIGVAESADRGPKY